jgi:hypothetical protein
LTATDAELLDTEQRRILHRFIQVEKKKKVDFGLAILRSLEQVGDDRDLPVVKRWADRTTKKPAEIDLKRAARECLPYIEERAQRIRAAGTLLRPVVQANDGQTLLRPLSNAPESNPHTLLRPTDVDSAERPNPLLRYDEPDSPPPVQHIGDASP